VNDDELKRKLAKLQADYAAQLPATVAQMEELWRCLVAAETAPLRLADLARMAHSIAGSGTTFGVPNASRAARELELFLDPFAQSGRLPGAAEQTTIAALLAALRQAAIQH
jgi:HPt (histidine-containing phosphotransfer) domain-containing protein